MQNNNEEKIDFKKKLAEWKVTVKTRWWILLVELAVIGVILLVDLLTKNTQSHFCKRNRFKEKMA